MSGLTPPPQFGFGVIPPTSVGPQVSPEDWRLIESKIQEKATTMTDNVEITEGVGDELILTGGKSSPRPRLVIAEDAVALEAHFRAKFAAEQPTSSGSAERENALRTEVEKWQIDEEQPLQIRAVAKSWFRAGWDARDGLSSTQS